MFYKDHNFINIYCCMKQFFFCCISISQDKNSPLKIGVIGLTHSHVGWVFDSNNKGNIEIIGIVEPNLDLAKRYSKAFNFSLDLVYSSMDEMFEHINPEAVTSFGTTYEHLEVVKKAAPKGIHVMVEKPMAVSVDHAIKMQELANKHDIHLITNYETTWYPTTHKAFDLIKNKNAIGDLRKIMLHYGHKGPKKIGINDEFLEWLTDPVLNGGGADFDFGCYGANILTWIMDGKKPNSVTAITKQLQAENNPKVNDESIILLEYDSLVAVIQASWNWPIARKDMEIYGLKGAIYADNRNDLRIRISEGYDEFSESRMKLEEMPIPYNDPFLLLTALVRDEIKLKNYDLNSLENNMIVVEILEAARTSAKEKKTVFLD